MGLSALRIFHYSPLIYLKISFHRLFRVENLSLFAFDILILAPVWPGIGWESFIIRLWYTLNRICSNVSPLRIFHYSPLIYLQRHGMQGRYVENLSLFAFDILTNSTVPTGVCWESFIIRLWYTFPDAFIVLFLLRIFHYSPLIYFSSLVRALLFVENLSLFAFDILFFPVVFKVSSWESFIIRLWYTWRRITMSNYVLRIFHYSPLIYLRRKTHHGNLVENLSLFAFDILSRAGRRSPLSWESFIIRLWYTFAFKASAEAQLRIFHYSPLIYFMGLPPHHQGVENLSLFAFDILGFMAPWKSISWESFIIRLWYT